MSQLRPNRSAGILLHPTSLPGPYGIGDLGPTAYQWVDQLVQARQTWWQILPLGPTGFADSPYQCFSAFAGNPNLVSPELLVQDGLMDREEIQDVHLPDHQVDYGQVIPFKQNLLRQVWEHFRSGRGSHLKSELEQFRSEKKHWLADYALFMALKEARRGQPWYTWPRELLRPDGENRVIEFARQELVEEVGLHEFSQFLFFRQWQALRQYARSKKIHLIGDAPIFVSEDSADVWANAKLFLLDGTLRPKVVAGVPPDYFSATGQLWGNPHYDWDVMAQNGYQWWIDRLKATLELVDVIRLDHFRGFAAAWQIPYGELTAVNGRWVDGPREHFFDCVKQALNGLPIIAEDLGEITPDVYDLRDRYDLPGMKILQFAFDGPKNPFLPHNYNQNCVVYTGTHDNDTTRGWYSQISDGERWYMGRYLNKPVQDVAWELIRLAWGSVADYAIAPMQDLLDLGTECRMNFPGKVENNWRWRLQAGQFNDDLLHRIADLTEVYGRHQA